MAKKEKSEFDDEKNALIIVPESQDQNEDTLVLLPGTSSTQDALVLLPDEQSEDDTLVLLSEPEDETETEGDAKKTAAHLPDENKAKHDISQRIRKTGWKKRKETPTWRSVGMKSLTNLPASIAMIRGFMKAINWKEAQEEVLEGLGNIIVIVGQPNTGKSTLFNQLKGEQISEVSPQAGTTKSLIRTDFGPFTLIDTPGHLPDVMESGMNEASLIVLLLDGEKGLLPDDRNLLMSIKKLEKPVIVAVNKIDTLKNEQSGDDLANQMAMRLGMAGVIPISARSGINVAEELVPAMIAASPEAALVIGRELPAYRREAAQRIIRNSMLVSLAAGLEPIPLVDIPILLGTQVRLVLRIAALYGEPIDSADALKHARELVVTMISGLGMRFLAEQVAKAVPFGGDIIAGAIAGAATWSIGEVALQYYEGGKKFDRERLRSMTGSFYKRFRQERYGEELRGGLPNRYTIEEESKPKPLLAEPGNPEGKRD